MWPRIVAGIFIPVGNHYFQALASTLQFVAQVCDRLRLVPATDRAFAYITYMSPPHVALVCSGPPQCAARCGWTKWPVCSGPKSITVPEIKLSKLLEIRVAIPYPGFVRTVSNKQTNKQTNIQSRWSEFYKYTRLPVTRWVKLSLNFEFLVPK